MVRFNKNIIDSISNNFGSTFSLISESTLANMLCLEELEVVESIIKKHLGSDAIVEFTRTYQLSKEENGKDIWLIKITKL